MWASLYQQRPAAAEGAIFKRDQWRFYDQAPELKRVILSIDTAFKTGAENDFSVIAAWGEGATGYYLLSLWRDRVEFPLLKQTLVNIAAQWKPRVVLIEDAASGQSLIQELKNSTALPVKPVKVDRDKVSRAYAVTPLCEAGRVYLPQGAPWLADFLDEHSSFDKSVHDDQVDTTTQALNFFRGSGPPGISLLYKEWAAESEHACDGFRQPTRVPTPFSTLLGSRPFSRTGATLS